MSDVIHLAARQAARSFGDKNIFNSANFSCALCRIAGLKSKSIDGKLVEAILHGRNDIEQLYGGCHWKIIENKA